MMSVSLFSSFLSLELRKFGVVEKNMGYYFAILTGPYFLNCIFAPIVFGKLPARAQYVLSFLFDSVAFMLMGPSNWFDLPDRLLVVVIGLFVLGYAQALIMVPSMPDAIEFFQFEYKIPEGADKALDNKVNDTMSSIMSLVYCLSGFVGPIIGGVLYDFISYKQIQNIEMVAYFSLAVLFFIFNCGFNVFQTEKTRKEGLEALKKQMESVLGKSETETE